MTAEPSAPAFATDPATAAHYEQRGSEGLALQADGLQLPFADDAFKRVFTGHFYGHLRSS